MSDIQIQHIAKSYGDVQALTDVSLSVHPGELFGLIGPDGAGKTSLIRIITTLLLPDEGTASLGGQDVVRDFRALRNQIGYMPGHFSLYQDLSVEENLRFFATVFGSSIKENYELIRDIYVQIEAFKKRRAGKLSGGMKQKLALSCALIHKPKFLILDEPTTGVDAVSRKEFWDMLHQLQQKGITIFVSTPYMDEALRCDRVALIQKGRIMAVDKPEAIPEKFPDKLFSIRCNEMYALKTALEKHKSVKSVSLFGSYLHMVLQKNTRAEALEKELSEAGFHDLELQETPPGIEDSFIYLMTQQEDRND